MNYIFFRLGSKVIYIGPYELFTDCYKNYVKQFDNPVDTTLIEEIKNNEI